MTPEEWPKLWAFHPIPIHTSPAVHNFLLHILPMLFYPKIFGQKTTLVRLNPDSKKFGLSRFRRTLLFRKIQTFVLNKFELPIFKVDENSLSKVFSSSFVYLTHFWKGDYQKYFIISNDEIFKYSIGQD